MARDRRMDWRRPRRLGRPPGGIDTMNTLPPPAFRGATPKSPARPPRAAAPPVPSASLATRGEAGKRLCIPSFEGRYGEPWIYKTPHHPDYKKDRFERMVRVGLATSAAPTFLKALPNNGYVMVDGGLWANNPVMNALVDVLSCFELDRGQIQILSLGCGETTFKVDAEKARGGLFQWRDVFSAAMRAQSLNALGQAYLLVGKDNVLRIDAPETPTPIPLDDYRRAKAELPAMARSMVEASGHRAEQLFFGSPADTYEPCPL